MVFFFFTLREIYKFKNVEKKILPISLFHVVSSLDYYRCSDVYKY